ncbi:thioredoxin-like protein AAED1, chloroplastic isoform X1 [Zingiber officinale]|uniref:Thioredoxin-like protein AAED1, chloroplastic n=1 Tax=Zingiber officinale TaxID=94328 RepID=A0A8J5HFG2_ZINOF|nr:thioredoxin-like protein AAED1, chloroplastic isoform X1 [Zingiber officinale]XP_042461003.1 thioredoxin-like protein AAED1, chloroplastic isoform X1 [Zingiber officinale]KAG6523152.1 hypothetical protein ZIOFF_013005 [Zingiber officinale]
MAMPIRATLPATADLAGKRFMRRRSSGSVTATRIRNFDQAFRLFSPPKERIRCSRFFPPLFAVSEPIGGASAVTYEDLTNSLENVEVFDVIGKAIRITDLWRDRKAVIAFARHFGCVFCRKRADLLASKKELMDAAGVALVLVGPGTVEQAKAFVEQTKFEGEVYADPTHSSYDAIKFAYGVLTTFTPSAGKKILELYLEGYRQDWELSFKKNTVERGGWQQGGIIIAGPGVNNISCIHKDKEAGDDPPIEDIIKACCQ